MRIAHTDQNISKLKRIMVRTLQITNAIALVATILINYLSNLGIFSSNTISDISKKYDTLFTPAGYAFSIWGLIYILLFAFVIFYGPFVNANDKKEIIIRKTGVWFIISCLANSLWVFAWTNDHLLTSLLLMLILLLSLIKIISVYLHYHTVEHRYMHLFFVTPFSIYLGWISVALIANMAIYLKKAQWGGFGISPQDWTILLLAVAALINIYMIWKYRLYFTALVAVWAFSAIAVANSGNNLIFASSVLMAAILLVNIIIRFIIARKKNLIAPQA